MVTRDALSKTIAKHLMSKADVCPKLEGTNFDNTNELLDEQTVAGIISESVSQFVQSFPPSTCVECGRAMPVGNVQRCAMTPGGFCSWRIPQALAEWIRRIKDGNE
jgi:hypothetical protein